MVTLPAPGEQECGDDCEIAQRDHTLAIVVVDGLGHRSLASRATAEARRIFEADPFSAPAVYLANAHSAMRSTRGRDANNSSQQTLRYVGIGNISRTIITVELSRELFSRPRIVRSQVRKVQKFEYPWMDDSLLTCIPTVSPRDGTWVPIQR
jgi:hypothetical protein